MPRDHRLYLDDILEAVARIRTYIEGMDYPRFLSDQKTMDAVVRNLEVIGEAARALPEQVKDARREIDWRKIVGLRNLLAHEYFGVSARVVWDVVQTKLESLEAACRAVLSDDSKGTSNNTPDR
ncbi:MAG TPA: DUF86 domain-containing protein [Candidatus Methylomirabilis sp.]|nr:DUF86 domain-containing protein [Candidatus Methylomirabilis sp.]